MKHRRDVRVELAVLRERASSAIEHLRLLHRELGRTRETISRAEDAYRESLELLRRVEDSRTRRRSSRSALLDATQTG